MILVSRNIGHADIRSGSSVGGSNDSGVVDDGNFQRFRWLFLRKL